MKFRYNWLFSRHHSTGFKGSHGLAFQFSDRSPALAAKSSSLTKGTVQLDKIEQKTQEAIDSPTTSLKEIEKKGEGGFNEIQGSADREKMIRSKGTELPIVKQTEKALDKMSKD